MAAKKVKKTYSKAEAAKLHGEHNAATSEEMVHGDNGAQPTPKVQAPADGEGCTCDACEAHREGAAE